MNCTRTHISIVGFALILLVNAIALAGVAWNRSEPAESRLQLSERELGEGYEYSYKENSGIALRLDYRWPATNGAEAINRGSNLLTPAKMTELGFVVPATLDEETVRRYNHQLDRDALLVLEFNGPLYQQQLQQAQERLNKSTSDLEALPDNEDLAESLKSAREDLQRERHTASRLFVVDAGQDLQALRQRYPDSQRYSIVRGQVSAWAWRDDDQWHLGGSAQIPVAESINLPHRWHSLFESLPRREAIPDLAHSGGDKLFTAEVVFGKRLEPWVTGMQAGQP